MPKTLKEHLLKTTGLHFRQTLDVLEGVTEETAVADRRPDWPSHEYHVGQDGSVVGIVHHLAAWKQVYVELLRGRNTDPHDYKPESPGWTGLVAWLRQTGEAWLAEAAAVPEADLEKPLGVSGVSYGLTPLAMMQEMLEHEIEHLGQINYLMEARKCASA